MRTLFLIKLFFYLFFIPQTSYSQVDKSDYNLLWEITRNDLKKPSYLFGTMHLKDKRAFEFSDSMFLKLDACDAFATEVHPDSAFLFYTKIFSSQDTTDFLKKMMSPEAYELLKKELAEQEGITLDSLKNKNPFFIESLFDKKPPTHADDKDLFLDYYLCRIARRSGKLTFGLEKVEDHRSMVDLFFESFEPDTTNFPPSSMPPIGFGLERLLKTYQTGSLKKVQNLLNTFPKNQAYKDAALIKRNIIMADNMGKIMHDHSLFATMGTAHLPGEDGVIDLLQKRGYTLRPVNATFTGLADQFKVKEKDFPWHNYREDFHKFDIQFPGTPYISKYEKAGMILFDHYIHYNDPLEKNNYFVKVSPSFREEGQSVDSLLINSINYWFLRNEKNTNLKTKKIILNGIEGLEFNAQLDSVKYIRGRIFYTVSSLYFAGALRSDEELDNRDINHFFESFQIDKPDSYGWKKFNSKEGAFNILTPYKPDFTTVDFPVPDADGEIFNLKMNIFTVKDFKNGYLYMMRYNGLGEGHILENDTAFFDLAEADFVAKMGTPDTSFTIFKDGYEGREIQFVKPKFSIRIQIYLRGARTYLLLAQNLKSSDFTKNMSDFFSSFHFTPFEYSPLSNYDFEEEGFSASFPKKPTSQNFPSSDYEYPSKNIFLSYAEDPINNINYFTAKTTYSPYYQRDTVENLLDEVVENYNEYTDTLLLNKKIMIDSLPGRYYQLASNLTATIQHSYIIIKGNEQFQTYIFPPKEMPNEEIISFLSSIKISDTPAKVDLTSRKIESIMEAFFSVDSTTSAEAKVALNNHSLVESELPFIYQALEKEYPGDTILYDSSIGLLCDHLSITNDSTTASVISSNYKKFPKNEIRQIRLLTALGEMKTPESLTTYLSLFGKHQQAEKYNAYQILYPFRDSTNFLIENYDLLSSKINQGHNWSSQISTIVLELIKKDSIDHSFLNKDVPAFMDKIKSIVKKEDLLTKDSIGYFEYSWELSNFLKIVGKLDLEKSGIKYLKNLLAIKDPIFRYPIIQTLVNLDQKVSKKQWNSIAKESPLSKFYLLSALHSDSLLEKAPKKWLDKTDLALLGFHSRFEEDNYFNLKLDDFKIVKSFPFTYSKENYQIYVIQYNLPDEKGDFIGLTSQLLEQGKYNFYCPIFDYRYEPIEEGKMEERIQEYLDWYKKEDLKREEKEKKEEEEKIE